MKLTILPFGALTDVFPPAGFALEPDGLPTVAHLHAHLLARHPALAAQPFRYAVNQELVDKHHPLHPGDEVALLPPFSGG